MKKLMAIIAAIVIITTCLVLVVGREQNFVKVVMPLKYEDIINDASEEFDISPSLLCGLIYTESRFNSEAVSPAGAVGLTQINKPTFEWIKWRMNDERDIDFEDVKNPEISIYYGAFLLKHHIEEFGNVDLALCAYNAGRGSLIKWLDNDEYSKDGKEGRELIKIPFKETEAYVERVNEAQIKYQKLYKMK